MAKAPKRRRKIPELPEGTPKGQLRWVCSCGASFEETGFNQPGDTSGYDQYMQHVREHIDNDEPDRGVGLVDEDGVVWWKGLRSGAVTAGLIPYGRGYASQYARRRTQAKWQGELAAASTPYRGRIFIRDIPIPARLWDFFEESAARYEDYRDRTPESFGKWLFDVVAAYYFEHQDRYVLGRIAAEIVQAKGAA